MPNPINILAWSLVIIFGLIGLRCLIYMLLIIYAKARLAIYQNSQHRATRDIPPEVGQLWREPGSGVLQITNVFDNGNIGVSTAVGRGNSRVSWGENRDDWKLRVYGRRLWLTNP